MAEGVFGKEKNEFCMSGGESFFEKTHRKVAEKDNIYCTYLLPPQKGFID